MRITGAWQWRLRPTRLRSGACERAMTRDGTVGRSDATETNLAFHRDIDPVRMMRTRFADPIRASSLFGLHQQAGHMIVKVLPILAKLILSFGRIDFVFNCKNKVVI